jgi:uncharacterized protein YlxW (UPF0749 family)
MKRKIESKSPRNAQKFKSGKYLAVILTFLLGIFIALAIKQNDQPELLTSARESELVLILDDLTKQKDLLETELIKQNQVLESLKSGSNEDARQAAQDRIDQLILLSGTAPVSGRGIQVLITGDLYAVNSFTILDAVQELRDAGAVAIEINGIRVINSTYFTDTNSGMSINLSPIRSPYKILALGDPETLATALKIPGGMSEAITTSGGQVIINQYPSLEIKSSVPLTTPQFAVPIDEK